MNFRISDFLKNLTIISIIFGSFGLIISNIFVASFNLPIFEYFDTRVIYIGFIFSIFLVGHILIYAMFIDYENFLNNNFFYHVIISFFKFIFLSNFVFLLLNISDYSLFSENLTSNSQGIMRFLLYSPIITIAILGLGYEYIKNEGSKIYTFFLYLSLFCSIALFTYFYSAFDSFKSVLNFEFFIGFFCFMTFNHIYAVEDDLNRDVKVYSDSFFSRDFRSRNVFDKIFGYFILIVMIMITLTLYSKNIYKYLDRKWGGGKVKEIIIQKKDSSLKGDLIFQTTEYLFIEIDSSLVKVNWKDIERIDN